MRLRELERELAIAPNLRNREFNLTTAPNQVWVTDITYIPTDEGWLYLAAVKDLHTCAIAGWAHDQAARLSCVTFGVLA